MKLGLLYERALYQTYDFQFCFLFLNCSTPGKKYICTYNFECYSLNVIRRDLTKKGCKVIIVSSALKGGPRNTA